MSALPTSSATVLSSITIAAATLAASVALSSSKVNAISTYTLSIKPIAKAGFLQVALPAFVSTQLAAGTNNCNYTLTVNGSIVVPTLTAQNGASALVIPLAPSASNVSLLISSITNPPDNTPYSFIATQASDQDFTSVYGFSNMSFAMSRFDLIAIASAIRVVTKVNVPTNLIL